MVASEVKSHEEYSLGKHVPKVLKSLVVVLYSIILYTMIQSHVCGFESGSPYYESVLLGYISVV